ncbi:hypothetical protein L5515_012655 [Caenorhabditis briggsae]|uniref:Serpentine receptor class gamma n=1 Tax=Caenorhabditis briggsae TaxID=6238 RepID=A0AAE9EYV4_CAEBR|nr:hypothetical protein L5515_012655 [Caenorhabditis briggsae]
MSDATSRGVDHLDVVGVLVIIRSVEDDLVGSGCLLIWQFLFPFSLGTVVLCAVYFTRTILVTSPYYVYNEALDMYSIKADSDILSAYSNVINFMALSVTSSVILNTFSVLKLKFFITSQSLSTIERNLLFSTIASSIVQCAAAGNTFLLQIDPSRSTVLGQVAQVLLPFFSDFLTISQPYILILMSSKVRLEMLKMYFGKSPKVGIFFVKNLGRQSGSRASQVPRN